MTLDSPAKPSKQTFVKDRSRYNISNPFEEIKHHQKIEIPRVNFQGRQASWSADGRWLLVVGDSGIDGLVAVFNRWVQET